MQVQVLFPAPNKEAASDGRFFVFTTSTIPSSRNPTNEQPPAPHPHVYFAQVHLPSPFLTALLCRRILNMNSRLDGLNHGTGTQG